MAPTRILRVFPDSLRVEQALVDASASRAFVEATGYITIADLIDWCEGARFLGRGPCPPLTVRFVIAAAARALPEGPFGNYAREPAFARAAEELFAQLSLQDVTPDQLLDAAGALQGNSRDRVVTLVSLWKSFLARLEALGLADRAALLTAATQRLERSGDPVFGLPFKLRAFSAIEVHHVHDLPPRRLAVLDALARAFVRDFRGFSIQVPAANNPALDAVGDEVLSRIERGWQTLGAEAGREPIEGPLVEVIARLFAPAVVGVEAPLPPEVTEGLSIFTAPGARDETLGIAARVRAEIDAGVPPEEIAIVYRDLASETEALVEALEALGVPARVRLGVPLRATALGRLALELPEMVDDDFPVASVSRYLESRYASQVFADRLDPVSLLQRAGVRDDRLGRLPDQGAYAVRLETLADRVSRNEAARVRQLAVKVQRLLEQGRLLVDRDEAGAMLEAWWAALDGLGLFDGLRRHERVEGHPQLARFVERALARDQAAGEALKRLREDLAIAWRDAGLAEVPISRLELSRWLDEAAQTSNLVPRGPRSGAVEILEARAISGRHFQRVFVGGLQDGRFPARPAPLPLLGEEDRRALNKEAGRALFRLSAGEAGASLPFRQAEESTAVRALPGCRRTGHLESRPLRWAGPRVAGLWFSHRAASGGAGRADRDGDARIGPAVGRGRHGGRVESPGGARGAFPARHPSLQSLRGRAGSGSALRDRALVDGGEGARGDRRGACRFLSVAHPAAGAVHRRRRSRHDDRGVPARLSLRCRKPAQCQPAERLRQLPLQGPRPSVARAGANRRADRGARRQDARVLLASSASVSVAVGARAGMDRRTLKDRSREQLDAVIGQAIDDAEKLGQVTQAGHPALWKLGRVKATRMIHRIIFSDAAGLPFEGLEPLDAEVSFGDARSSPDWRSVVIPPELPGETPIHLHGKIDRLDRAESGEGAIGVVDYKAGKLYGNKIATLKKQLLHSEFQLPFYLQAVASRHPGKAADAALLMLGNGKHVKLSKLLDADVSTLLASDPLNRQLALADGRPNLANAVHRVVGELRAGNFAPRAFDCEHCSIRSVCRIRQRVLIDEDVPR